MTGRYSVDDIYWDDASESTESLDSTSTDTSSTETDVEYYTDHNTEMDSQPAWLQTLIKRQEVAVIDNTLSIYIKESSGWMPVRSTVGLEYLTTLTDKYAPVNYAVAVDPIVKKMERLVWPSVSMGTTFTQGSMRYMFKLVGNDRIILVPATMIKGPPDSKSTFCTIPVQHMTPIKSLSLSYRSHMVSNEGCVSWIRSVFGAATKTVLWVMGDILADFGNKRMFIMYGPGGIGKSSVINILSHASSGATCSISTQYALKDIRSTYISSIPERVILDAASARVALISDLEVTEGRELNVQSIKHITGGDQIYGVRLSTTILCSMNSLPKYSKVSAYVKADRIRRITVIPTVTKRHGHDIDTMPIDTRSLDELFKLAMVTRIKYSMPPLSVECVLHTLFQGHIDKCMDIVEADYSASRSQCMAGTMLLSYYFKIAIEDMTQCLVRIGTECCIEAYGMAFIGRIRPRVGGNIQDPIDIEPQNYIKRYKQQPSIPLAQRLGTR